MIDIRIPILIMFAAALIGGHMFLTRGSIDAFDRCVEQTTVENCTVIFDGNPRG